MPFASKINISASPRLKFVRRILNDPLLGFGNIPSCDEDAALFSVGDIRRSDFDASETMSAILVEVPGQGPILSPCCKWASTAFRLTQISLPLWHKRTLS